MDALSHPNRFVKHGPCPKCGSRDNLAWYSNGTGYCFGCRTFHIGSDSDRLRHGNSVLRHGETGTSSKSHGLGNRDGKLRPVPDDATSLFPREVVAWLQMYNLSVVDATRHNVVWSNRYERLYFQFFGADRTELLLWQCRNFKKGTTHKDRFFTEGAPNDVIAAYYPSESKGEASTAILVEGCTDALKIVKAGFTAVPCFGSGVGLEKLRRLTQQFKTLIMWLDHDKFKEATEIARRAGMLGAKTAVVYTEEDPKWFDVSDIQETINGKIRHVGG